MVVELFGSDIIGRVMRQSAVMFFVLMGVMFSISASASTLFFDDFLGSASTGIVSGVTFTTDTAVFGSHDDGIEYDPSLFPAEGAIEVSLRVDEVGLYNGSGKNVSSNGIWSTIVDSAGADARVAGDIFLQVDDAGIISFALSTGSNDPHDEFQVTSSSSILDGLFHKIGVSYGLMGISLVIDGVVEDSDPFTGLRDTGRAVSLGDFTDTDPPDGAFDGGFAFSFIGDVDWIRSSTSLDSVSEPATLLLMGIGLAGLGFARTRRLNV